MIKSRVEEKNKGIFKKVYEYVPDKIEGTKSTSLEEINKNIVTSSNNNIFNADEDSQNRILRAIKYLEITGANDINWILADNSIKAVSRSELEEVLVLSFEKQSDIWLSK